MVNTLITAGRVEDGWDASTDGGVSRRQLRDPRFQTAPANPSPLGSTADVYGLPDSRKNIFSCPQQFTQSRALSGHGSGHDVRHFKFFLQFQCRVAETEGFEPSVRFPVRRFSKALVSATHPRLRAWRKRGYSDGVRCRQHGIEPLSAGFILARK